MSLERFQAKACPGPDPGWKPVRVKKTRQIKNLELRFNSIETDKAPERDDFSSNRHLALVSCLSMIFSEKPVSTFPDHALGAR
jgi:hypothetical protein